MAKLTRREKIELGLIFASIAVVTFVGILVVFFGARASATGLAISSDATTPTQAGFLEQLNEQCRAVSGTGSCNEICGESICVPLEENCDALLESNSCYCCS